MPAAAALEPPPSDPLTADRPEAIGPRKVNYADSIESAAASLGYTGEFLQELKRRGCPAFRGSRVYLDEVEPWITANNLGGLEDEVASVGQLDAAIKSERLRRFRFENDIAEGRFLRKEDMADLLISLGMELKAVLQEKLEDQGPDRMTMKSRDELVDINRKIVDEICDLYYSGQLCRKMDVIDIPSDTVPEKAKILIAK